MINQASYLNRTSAATRLLDLLEANQTDKEFDAMVKRNRFLHECKTKGFKKLEELGLIAKPDDNGVFVPSEEERIEIAHKAKKLIDSGMQMKEVCEKVGGLSDTSVLKYMRMEGLVGEKESRGKISIDHVLKMVNEQGLSITNAAKVIGVTQAAVSTAMKVAGYSFDKKEKQYAKA